MPKIIPAILTNNFSDLEDKFKKLKGLTDWVQVDIADGKFVNNVSIKLEDIAKSDIVKNFSLEIHLMVLNPERYFKDCRKINTKRVAFHFEAVDNLKDVLSEAEKFSFQKSLALNPKTSITKVKPYLAKLDVVVLMSVAPGFQGQKFMRQILDKIKKLKKMKPEVKIEVDGGINLSNIKKISDSGADYLVVGSSLFKSGNIKETFKKLKEKIK